MVGGTNPGFLWRRAEAQGRPARPVRRARQDDRVTTEEAILAGLKRGGTIYSENIRSRLPGHKQDDIEFAVAMLETDERIVVLHESSGSPHPYSFSGLTLNPATA
jgi:hypothetical protein